ncbi:hypothetical protein MHBO_001127 [Bonamia ostreae]|uniref:Uncharacterized protein n=1 Tax=Bonamia ostreae TaxID=126728 RepID=A0ABV2AIR7_9EUKA
MIPVRATEKKCRGTENYCAIFAETEGRTCKEYCEAKNTMCIASFNEINDSCREKGEDTKCASKTDDQICFCHLDFLTLFPRKKEVLKEKMIDKIIDKIFASLALTDRK